MLRNDFGQMDIICSYCKAFHWAVEQTNSHTSIKSTRYIFESCCKKGKVKIDAFHEPPPELWDLLLDDSPQGKAFCEHICQYNFALTFTSLGYKKDNCPKNQQGCDPFQIYGELYHLQGLLKSNSDNSAQYSQLFFYDPTCPAELWHHCNQNLDLTILQELTRMLHCVNPFISMYKTAREQLREANNDKIRIVITPQL